MYVEHASIRRTALLGASFRADLFFDGISASPCSSLRILMLDIIVIAQSFCTAL
jgi:hypothetical protein